MIMDSYYTKYLKYKNKYLTLANKLKQNGGAFNDYRDITNLTNENFKEQLNINMTSLTEYLHMRDSIKQLQYNDDIVETVDFNKIDLYIDINTNNFQKHISDLSLNKIDDKSDLTVDKIIFYYYYLTYIIKKYLKNKIPSANYSYNEFIDLYNILQNKSDITDNILKKIYPNDNINYNQLLFIKHIFNIYFEKVINIDNKFNKIVENILFYIYLCNHKYINEINTNQILIYIYTDPQFISYINKLYEELINIPQDKTLQNISFLDNKINLIMNVLKLIHSKINIIATFDQYQKINNNNKTLFELYNNTEKNEKINIIIYDLIINFTKELDYDNIIKLNRNICIRAYNNMNDTLFFDIFKRPIIDNLYCNDGYHFRKPCNFSNIHMFIEGNTMTEYNKKILCSDIKLTKTQIKEQNDYINEMLYIIITPNDKVIHSGNIFNIIGFESDKGTHYYSDEFIEANNKNILWWLYNYVGQSEYNGGWFTFNQHDSGPATFLNFGFCLKYNITESFPLLFIPPIYLNKYIKNRAEYFDEINPRCSDTITSLYAWSGSHLFEGVKNWKQKGYDKILKTSKENEISGTDACDKYADDFTNRIISLGFNGYISCDECEVFLNYNFQKKYLSTPPLFYIINSTYVKQTFEDIVDIIKTNEVEKTINEISKKYNNEIKNITTIANRNEKNIFLDELKQIIDNADQETLNKMFKYFIPYTHASI
jgi:hypothetical protein